MQANKFGNIVLHNNKKSKDTFLTAKSWMNTISAWACLQSVACYDNTKSIVKTSLKGCNAEGCKNAIGGSK